MANTRFQHKRSTVSGVVPTTSDIISGELGINLADRRLFTSNGTAVFELGSNLTSLAVGNSTVRQVVNTTGAFVNGNIGLIRNDTRLTFTPTAGGANVYLVQQSDDNFVLYTTNTSGTPRPVFSVFANTNTPNQNSAFTFRGPVDFSTAGVYANNSLGSSGQVLHSNGSGVYWADDDQGVTSVATGVGLTGGTITTTGTVSVLANNGITANSTGLFVTQGTGAVVNSTGVHVNTTFIGTLAANSASFLGNSSGTLANIASWVTGNSATAFTNATTFASNATNISTGSLANARLPSAIDVTSVNAATLSVGTNFIANSTVFRTISTLLVPGSSGEGGQIVMGYGNNLATTITGQNNNTFNIDVVGGNTGSTPLLRIFTQNGDGSTTAILNAANTGRVHIGSVSEQTDSTFKVTGTANITANAAIGGALTAANVTATLFTGALTGTASNATNLNSQPGSFYTNATNITTGTLPWAQAPSGTVNTSGAFTITGINTFQANIVLGNTTVNTQHSNATILISNSTSTTTLGLTDLRIGNTATNVVISNTVSSFGGNVSVTGAISSANVTATLFTGSLTGTASNATNLNSQPGSFYTNATNLTTGTVPTARLGSGTANSTTFLRGDQTWAVPVANINTAAQYAWTNTHTFAANVNFDSGTLFVDATNNRVGIVNSTPGSSLTVTGDVAANFFVNPTTITASYTIPTNFNAMSAGPITVGTGAVVTVPNGSTWTIV